MQRRSTLWSHLFRAQSHWAVTGALLASLACVPALHAQAISGGIYGKLKQIDNATVQVTNPATGYRNRVTPDASGYYSLSNLAPGTYRVQLMRGGAAVSEQTLAVRAGAASAVVFKAAAPATAASAAAPSAASAQSMAAISVSADAAAVTPIDVSTVENTRIWNLSDVNNLPTPNRNLEGIATLQSNVNAAGRLDSAQGYSGGYVQFNGATPAENRYYVNQFDTTNGSNLLTPTQIPDEAVSTVQVKSTGYGVQYGSTTGGVTSGTVKQGSNDFKMGGSLYFTPPTSRRLNPNQPDVRNIEDPSKYNSFNSATHREGRVNQNLWASGALIKDKLFFYALATNEPPARETTYGGNGGTTKQVFNQKPAHSALINLTYNIRNDQSVDLLLYRQHDTTHANQYRLADSYNPGSADKAPYNYSDSIDNEWLGILNYTGAITESLHVSAMTGFLRTRNANSNQSLDEGGTLPAAQYFDYATQQFVTPPGGAGPGSVTSPFVYTKKGYRLDFDWYATENHHLSFGLDRYSNRAKIVSQSNPQGNYIYYVNQCGSGAANCALPNGTQLGNNVPYVAQYLSLQADDNENVAKSLYVDDTWQVSNNVILYAGLRHDTYQSKNDLQQLYLKLPINSPRLGVSWDVHGDSTLKLGATLGRYATTLGVNYNDLAGAAYIDQTSYSTYACGSQYCAANGYLPQNAQQVGPVTGVNGNVPPVVDGQVSHNIRPTFQDELSVYALQQVNNHWTVGATFYVSKLRNLMQYWNDPALINSYFTQQGIGYQIPLDQLGYLYNPGKSLNITVPVGPGGSPQRVTIPNSFLGMPSPKRKTYQLTFTLDHAPTAEEPWFLDASYTWQHLFGNTSGAVNATGSANSNVFSNGYDQAWQAPAYLDGAGGNLQADARNTFKLNGYYKFPYGLRLGGTLTASSGVPLSCYNFYPYPDDNRLPASGNSQDSYYCGGRLISRGSAGKTSFWDQLDLDAGYDWTIAGNAFSVDLKMTNVFNRNAVLQKNQIYNSNASATEPSATYMTPSLLQYSRTTMLVFRWQYH